MLERIETLYGSNAQPSKDGLRAKFFGFKYDSSKGAVNNCLEINNLIQELRSAGEEVKDEWILSRILNCLQKALVILIQHGTRRYQQIKQYRN